MNKLHKAMLVILDGWGLAKDPDRSAIDQAKTPFFDQIWSDYPHSRLLTHGPNVGLPDGQMGNSEVGHLNIGAGRVVFQDLMLINTAIEDKTIQDRDVYKAMVKEIRASGGKMHIIGLLSDGGVHAHIDHLIGLVDMLHDDGAGNILIHGFLDGRDTDPQKGGAFVQQLENAIKHKARLVSLIGRYYAMDRDQRWDRIKRAYDLLIHGEGERVKSWHPFLKAQYEEGITDEFMTPAWQGEEDCMPVIKEGDVVLFYNFRTDRPRQLTAVLTQHPVDDHDMRPQSLRFYTMTEYDQHFKDVHVLFRKSTLQKTFGEVLAGYGLNQLRAAETEKYPHVTYFLNGGREEAFESEERILVPSPKVATYDLQPEMSAGELTERVRQHLMTKEPTAIVINFANTDMVGHTGDFQAAILAAEAVDNNLSKLCSTALSHGYRIMVIADHGNADYMINDDGSPNTAHSLNPVPCIVLGAGEVSLEDGILADVSPTLLDLIGLDQPEEMTGTSLITRDE